MTEQERAAALAWEITNSIVILEPVKVAPRLVLSPEDRDMVADAMRAHVRALVKAKIRTPPSPAYVDDHAGEVRQPPVPADLREVVADTIGWTDTDGNMTFGERAVVVLQAIAAAGYVVSRPSPEEPKTPPEPIYNAVERILDEKSAWVACPNNEVTMRIASDIRNKFHKTRLTHQFYYAFDPDDVDAVIEALERSAAKSHSTSTD